MGFVRRLVLHAMLCLALVGAGCGAPKTPKTVETPVVSAVPKSDKSEQAAKTTPPAAVARPDLSQVSGAIITYTFDDGYDNVMVASQILKESNQVGVLFAITNYVDQPNRVTRNDLKTLQAMGWEIGSHTVSHPNLPMIDRALAEKELVESKRILEKWGLQVHSLAYPYVKDDPELSQLVAKYYESARISGQKLNLGLPTGPGRDVFSYVSGRRFLPVKVKQAIDEAIAKRAWLVLTFHQIVQNDPLEYANTEEEFRQIAEYAAAKIREGKLTNLTQHEAWNVMARP